MSGPRSMRGKMNSKVGRGSVERRQGRGGGKMTARRRLSVASSGGLSRRSPTVIRVLLSLVLLLHLPALLLAMPFSAGDRSSCVSMTRGISSMDKDDYSLSDEDKESRTVSDDLAAAPSSGHSHSSPTSSSHVAVVVSDQQQAAMTWIARKGPRLKRDEGADGSGRRAMVSGAAAQQRPVSEGPDPDDRYASVEELAAAAAAAAAVGGRKTSRNPDHRWTVTQSSGVGRLTPGLEEVVKEEEEEGEVARNGSNPRQRSDDELDKAHVAFGSTLVSLSWKIMTRGGGGGGGELRIRPIRGSRELSGRDHYYGLEPGVCSISLGRASVSGEEASSGYGGYTDDRQYEQPVPSIPDKVHVASSQLSPPSSSSSLSSSSAAAATEAGGIRRRQASLSSSSIAVATPEAAAGGAVGGGGGLIVEEVTTMAGRGMAVEFRREGKSGDKQSEVISLVDDLWPPSARLVIASVLAVLAGALANAGGVGGGGLFVPLFNLLLQFDPKTSVALSKSMILGGAVVSFAYNISHRHPSPSKRDRPLIDYDVTLLLQPMLLLGISVGVLCNVVFPSWLVLLLLVALLSYVSFRSFRSACRMWKKESLAAMAAGEAAERKTNHHQSITISEEGGEEEGVAKCCDYDNRSRNNENNGVNGYYRTREGGEQEEEEKGEEWVHSSRSDVQRACTRSNHDDGGDRDDDSTQTREHEERCPSLFARLRGGAAAMSDSHLTEKLLPSPPPPSPPPPPRRPPCCCRDLCGRSAAVSMNKPSEERRKREGERTEGRLKLPWKKMAMLVVVWLLFFVIQVVKSGKICINGRTFITSCGLGYWLITLSQIPLACIVTGIVIYTFYKENERRLAGQSPAEQGEGEGEGEGEGIPTEVVHRRDGQCGDPLIGTAETKASCTGSRDRQRHREGKKTDKDGDPILGTRELFLFPMMTLTAGVMGGLLGLGGGMVICPLLLELGFEPQVTSATGIFIVLFSSSMSVAEYGLLGRIPVGYAVYFSGICAFASWLGHAAIAKIIKRWGRVSVIIFATSAVILVSVGIMGVFGTLEVLELYKEGANMGFGDVCKSI
ncbi:hypothetical protein CBR_g3275 [Chara braunii]|uniref:Sulfite exporter TauE/SafE family protein n=1 Tax=Chara braunii TaxID=69332 RepID=A0A388KFK2_CHABU|nr:hypothetical protein CBR_g3275 [Chara braunii]|eukprot:GBG68733.1 hypothetical protein CBR_g3275 [Chara braunii]